MLLQWVLTGLITGDLAACELRTCEIDSTRQNPPTPEEMPFSAWRATASTTVLICSSLDLVGALHVPASISRTRSAFMQVQQQEAIADFYSQAQEKAERAEVLAEWRTSEGTASWYDAGVRLSSPEPEPESATEAEPDAVAEVKAKPKLTASAEASLAAALLSGLAVLGIDIAGAGVIENADAALLVGGIALSQVDEEGPVGETLRTVGNVTSFVVGDVVAPTVSAAADVYTKNELGYKARALLEIGIESALYAVDPDRREREQAETEAERQRAQAAVEAAARQAEKETLPWWSPEKYS